MSNTKEKILMTALHLFATDGYEAVSMSTIAGELGITKGALYKHYKNKRDIFDSIVKRMYEIDEERARKYGVPEKKYDVSPISYKKLSMYDIKEFTIAQFEFWTENAFASDFRRMLTIEQYRNSEMSKLYSSCITTGPVAYTEDMFRTMMEEGILKKSDSRRLANEFYSLVYLLINTSDHFGDREESRKMISDYIDKFIYMNLTEEIIKNEFKDLSEKRSAVRDEVY